MSDPQLAASYESLLASFLKDLKSSVQSLEQHSEQFLNAYSRLASLNSWRAYLLQGESPDAVAFFLEGQNDGLTSLVLARAGMWRTSLQALRSCVENVLACLYFQDHPVELRLWAAGKFRLGFQEMKSYFEIHPDHPGTSAADLTGLPMLDEQYRVLSRAVHGSGTDFRMVQGTEVPVLCTPETKAMGQWCTNQRQVMLGLNLLMIMLFSDRLQGTAMASLRAGISLALPSTFRPKVKSQFGVHIPKP